MPAPLFLGLGLAAAGGLAWLAGRGRHDGPPPIDLGPPPIALKAPNGGRMNSRGGFTFASAYDLLKEPMGTFTKWSEAQKIAACHPDLAQHLPAILDQLKAQGYQPVLGNTWRSMAVQAALQASGTSQVSFSFHNTVDDGGFPAAMAADIVDKRYGWGGEKADDPKAVAAAGFFAALGVAAKSRGLAWGGDWKNRKSVWSTWNMGWDPVHIQCRPNSALKAERVRCLPLIHGESRVVEGKGGYTYRQFASGWVQIESGPDGAGTVLGPAARAFAAITDEIRALAGGWGDRAAGDDQAGGVWSWDNPNDLQDLIALLAAEWAGAPYSYGGGGPNAPVPVGSAGLNKPPRAGWDCSGLTLATLAALGRVPWEWTGPRSSSALAQMAAPVKWGAQMPGDLAFYPGHVSVIATVPRADGDSDIFESGGGRSNTNGDDPRAKVRWLSSIKYRPDLVTLGRLPTQSISPLQRNTINALSAILRGAPANTDPAIQAELRRRYGGLRSVTAFLGATT